MKGTICGRSYEHQYAFLEKCQALRFLMLESKLFHSTIVEGKKEFLKLSCVTLKREILFLRLVIYDCLVVGIN